MLEERRLSYDKLIDDSGGLAIAAYRVARARCLVGAITTNIPTLREIAAAACEISANAAAGGFRPDASILAGECEQAGLAVITPLSVA